MCSTGNCRLSKVMASSNAMAVSGEVARVSSELVDDGVLYRSGP